jgi:hypothetical protein
VEAEERQVSKARIVNCTNAEYHADKSSLSNSGLKLVIESPALYHHQYLSGNYVREEKQYFDDGTALDEALLQPSESCGSNVVVIPRDVLARNGSRVGKKWAEFRDANVGKTLVKDDDKLLQWIRAVQAHPAARDLIETDGRFQETIYWHDDEFDIDRRARFDKILLGEEYIVDLKTTIKSASLRECANAVANFGYHRQVSYYQDAAEALYGHRPKFIFIFVSKIAPYRVETFELDDEFIEYGREQNARGLATYAECLRTGKWMPKTHGSITKLSPPGWVRWEKEWSK